MYKFTEAFRQYMCFILQIAANKLAIIRSAGKFSALRLNTQSGSMIDIVQFKHVSETLQSKEQ